MLHPPLPTAALRRTCDPTSLGFETSETLLDLHEPLGQERAIEALRFALSMDAPGYNVFVLGPPGAGKRALVLERLRAEAASRATPPDWCYVYDFQHPNAPTALSLPAGRGRDLARDMEKLVEDLRVAIPAAFEGRAYGEQVERLQKELEERHEAIFQQVQEEGARHDVAVMRSPSGFVFAPLKNGKPLDPEEFERLPEAERKRLEEAVTALQESLKQHLQELPKLHRETRDKVRALHREATAFAVDHTIEELVTRYADLPQVVGYLRALRDDAIEHSEEFRKDENETNLLAGFDRRPHFERYRVNLFVDNTATRGAPVVYEDNPVYEQLVGRFEHQSQLGNLVTDFTMIRAGALHRANGGYLLVDALELLRSPMAWQGLKRALSGQCLRIEPLTHLVGIMSARTLEPEPIPLEVKVVLLGHRYVYYLLGAHDPDLPELFKVEADFEDVVPRVLDNEVLLCRMLATMARRETLRPLHADAMARLVEEASRHVGDSRKLSTHARTLFDWAREADHWASARGSALTRAEDVDRALAELARRRDRVRRGLREATLRGLVLLDTTGEHVGQINGLAAIALGEQILGHPTRITATARIGDGKVVDIEREVELGGQLHSKGVLILSNYLGYRYARNYPLSLSASLVFEQSYAGVEGDSASLAELACLLSALGDIPLDQGIAVTGSVNQRGQVQAIGAVNEKIEGFFELCQDRGLTGDQGVLIPAANVEHLMLRPAVVEAAAAGLFRIFAVKSIDEAMEVLTGLPSGTPDEHGELPAGSINQRIQEALVRFAVVAKTFTELVEFEGDEEPESAKPETPTTETPNPQAPKPEGPKPEAPKPEAPKPEAPKPEQPVAAEPAPHASEREPG